MVVDELYKALEPFLGKDLDVKIHPEQELFIAEGLTAHGDVGDIEEKTLYWSETSECYFEEEDWFDEYVDNHYTDQIEEQSKNMDKVEKLHALFIKAVV